MVIFSAGFIKKFSPGIAVLIMLQAYGQEPPSGTKDELPRLATWNFDLSIGCPVPVSDLRSLGGDWGVHASPGFRMSFHNKPYGFLANIELDQVYFDDGRLHSYCRQKYGGLESYTNIFEYHSVELIGAFIGVYYVQKVKPKMELQVNITGGVIYEILPLLQATGGIDVSFYNANSRKSVWYNIHPEFKHVVLNPSLRILRIMNKRLALGLKMGWVLTESGVKVEEFQFDKVLDSYRTFSGNMDWNFLQIAFTMAVKIR